MNCWKFDPKGKEAGCCKDECYYIIVFDCTLPNTDFRHLMK
jgi:hypothetical protein